MVEKVVLNYGLNTVRFPSPVRVGSGIRGRMTIVGCERVGGPVVQLVTRTTIEVKGSDKPACVADPVSRYHFAS